MVDAKLPPYDRCPHCKKRGDKIYYISRAVYYCKACRKTYDDPDKKEQPDPKLLREEIKGVAMCLPRGAIVKLPRPARHGDLISHMIKHGYTIEERSGEQGFYTTHDRFVGRREACVIAQRAGQIVNKTHPPDTLFSEDMW